jgi:hypothetical protein
MFAPYGLHLFVMSGSDILSLYCVMFGFIFSSVLFSISLLGGFKLGKKGKKHTHTHKSIVKHADLDDKSNINRACTAVY